MTSQSPPDQSKTVREYHGLPLVTLIVVVLVFLASFELAKSYILATFFSAIPAVCLLALWIKAARKVDAFSCDSCGRTFKARIPWTYPPTKCPYCGHRRRN